MKKLLCLILLLTYSCKADSISHTIKNSNGTTIKTRFKTPPHAQRTIEKPHSFASYLRSLPLQKDGYLVAYYDGSVKENRHVYDAVIDLPIGKKDLHQCADAVMRLRAEYLYKEKKYNKIHFNFTNGFKCDFVNWSKGKRIGIKGNKTWWKQSAKPSKDYKTFWSYMEQVFMYAGTYSLSKELKKAAHTDIQIGDVFIQGGFPGHAIIVVDKAVDALENKTYFMLAQSYMPAQEAQVLMNQHNTAISPWYVYETESDTLDTPEWIFLWSDRKRFTE